MTQKISRDDIALYVMGTYDGDVAALEARIAGDAAARTMLAEEAALELSLRDAGAAGTFCPSCDDLVADATEPRRCVSCGAAVNPGGYRVERVIVANAHGRMYVARDADGTHVALKELAFVQSPSAESVGAFEREAKFLRALEHPAIPRFRAAFEEGSGVHTRYYLAQDLVEGTALDARLDDHFFTEAEIVDIARQVLGVLVYLQSVSPMVIHRDIKPANLITRPDGKIAVVDFGAAHVQGTTAGSTSIGTFGYMPLEQLAGQVDATTDTYALGASLIHLLTRREPWRVFGPATFESINVSAALQQFLAKCVAPEPKDRFPNAAAALAGLDAPATAIAVRTPRIPRGAWRVAIGVLAAALTLGGAGVAGYHLRGEPAAQAPAIQPQDKDAREGEPTGYRDYADSWDYDVDFPTSSWVEKVERFRRRAQSLRMRLLDRYVPQQDLAHMERDRVEQEMLFKYGQNAPKPIVVHPRYANPQLVSLSFKGAQLPEVLRSVARACGVNVVMSDSIQGPVTLSVTDVPCSQILEVILESNGLGYAYDPPTNFVRIGPRRQIEHELEEERERQRVQSRLASYDDKLPAGDTVDFDYANAQTHDLAKVLADTGKVNIVIPDGIRPRVTIIASKTPWDATLKQILAVNGLWLRYRPDGRIVRVAPRKELDHEDEEPLEKVTPR